MSAIYHTEPPTCGKVLLVTTFGDIDIELWSKEAPLACRNFIQLGLEGYYDNCLVHRIIKESLIQTGDPTGTGRGGESIWGRPFKDEIHGRIKFNHRGQVAMANENKSNSNKSQFFITLAPCEWLNRKHTIFGKVTGNTVFNVIRAGDVEVDANDRPFDELKVLKMEVLWNPFDDIVPRDLSQLKHNTANASKPDEKQNKLERKGTKDTKLLSFGDEEQPEDEEGEARDLSWGKIQSSHEAKQKTKRSTSRKMSSTETMMDAASKREPTTANDTDNPSPLDATVAKAAVVVVPSKGDIERIIEEASSQSLELKERSEEYQRLRSELLRSRKAVNVLSGMEVEQKRTETAYNDLITPLEQMRMRYKKRKNEHGDRSEETLMKLKMFTNSLRSEKISKKSNGSNAVKVETKRLDVKDVVEEVREMGNETEMEETTGWHIGKLKFTKHIDDQLRNKVGSDGRKTDDYEYSDSRLQKN